MKDQIIIDVRESDEFKKEHIQGSLNIPLSVIDVCGSHVFDIFYEKNLIIFCNSGNRSCMALKKIKNISKNKQTIEIYEGGIQEFKKQGGEMVIGRKVIPLMRQVQVTVGSLNIIGSILSLYISVYFVGILFFVGCGLLYAGLTGKCGLAKVLGFLPFNK